MNEAVTGQTQLTEVQGSKRSILWQSPLLSLGVGLLSIVLLLVLIGPWIVHNDPLTVQMSERLQSSSWKYPLGTDHMGRCIFSRLVEGAKSTLGISFLVIATIALIGIPLGLVSGYVGGRLDSLLMRILDTAGALPEFVVAIAIAGFLGSSLFHLMIAIVWVKWIHYARVARGIVLSERNKEYILAARVAGSGVWAVLRRHLLRQIVSPILVLVALDIGKIIMMISMMSYLGLGAQPPVPEWGAMLNDGRPYFQTAPTLMIYPGVAILLVVVACNLIGDGLRDRLDVRSR